MIELRTLDHDTVVSMDADSNSYKPRHNSHKIPITFSQTFTWCHDVLLGSKITKIVNI